MKKSIFIVVGIACAGFVWYASALSSVVDDSAEEKVTVKTAALTPTLFQETVTFSGFIRGEKQSDAAAQRSGTLVRLAKDEGDSVRRGETLAVIDASNLSAAQESALHSLRAMESTLRAATEYYDQKVDEARTASDNASGSHDRESAEEALKSSRRLRDVELESLKMQKIALEGSLLVAEANTSTLIVRAPFDGIVTAKHVSVGSFVAPGLALYSIASSESFEISVSLPQEIASRIAKGSTVVVSDTRGGRAEGVVAALGSAAEESSQRSIARVRFASLLENFRIGQHVRVSFPVGVKKDTLLIDEQSIVMVYDDAFVFVVENDTVRRYRVELGRAAGSGYREVLSELPKNARLVVDGMHSIYDGQEVTETYVD